MKKIIGLLLGIFMLLNIFPVGVSADMVNEDTEVQQQNVDESMENVSTSEESNETISTNSDNSISVKYTTHVQKEGWQNWVSNGELSGTSGKALRVEALKIDVEGSSNTIIKYRTHVQKEGWQDWVSNGELSGTTGKALRIEALEIKAENLPTGYHIEYRAHVQKEGWQDWVSNGELAGTTGKALRVEAIQIRVVSNNQYYSKVKYSSKPIDGDWEKAVNESATSGQIGKDLEALKINVDKSIADIKYRGYIQGIGWQEWTNNGETVGQEESKKKISAIQIEASGLSDDVQCLYRVYVSGEGWQAWRYSGQQAGTTTSGGSIQAIQVRFEDKNPSITYQGNIEKEGVQDWVSDGSTAGTEGKALRLEGIKLKLNNFDNGSITYRAYVQNKGWLQWKNEGELAGTIGEGLRLEAIEIKGVNLPSNYQIQYRAHVQSVGWQEWKTDGQTAGTTEKSLRIEAIQVRIVRAVKMEPIQCIDSPANNSIITDKFSVSGWSLSYSGVEKVQAYVDGKLLGETVPNTSREDVYKVYPQYDKHNSGFKIDNIDITTIAPGNRTLEIRQFGNDGYIHHAYKQITIKKKDNITTIDAPTSGYLESSDKLYIKGWALNGSGVAKVNVYIDNVLKATIKTDQTRNDVAQVYPGYNNDNKSGYTTNISLSGLKAGKHTLKISPVGNDGTIQENTRDFYYKNKGNKTIVVDAGHNYGGDYGATATHYGVTYSETELNMKIADYLRTYLESAGYNVIMTRKTSDKDVCNVNQSLANRVSIANKSDAVLFISIHQNAATASAHGVEVYSTTNSPDKGYSWDNYSDKINKSKQLATKVVNSIASNVGFYNRGAKTANLYVLRNTRMPAILVECGFITNYSNATALSVDLNQRKIASSITEQVKAMYPN